MIILQATLPGKWNGITLFPFIIVEDKNDKVLINHEAIHYQQQKELWIIGFYIWYLWEHFKRGHDHNIFEKEAEAYKYDLTYLKTRKKFNFLE
jgi:hypothetical protein